MWWLDAIANGFSYDAPSLQACVFRVILATAIAFKFAYEHARGAWSWFAPDSYVAYRFRREHPRLKIGQRGYRVLYIAKLLATGCLLVGVVPQLAALVLAVWFFFERQYDRKFHTTYLGLCALFLAACPALDDALTFGVEPNATENDVFAQLLIVLLTVQMYLSSAYRKLRSKQFMSGAALYDFTRAMQAVRDEQPHRETWYPRIVVRHLIDVPPETAHRRWRPAAIATVALEFALPVALLIPATYPFAVVAGTAMHLAFAATLPVRLPPYSLAAIGSYVLFANPAWF